MQTARTKVFKSKKSDKMSRVMDVLYRIVDSVNSESSASDLSMEIYQLVSQLIPCDFFAIALCYPSSDELHFVFTVADGKCYPPVVQKLEADLIRDAIANKRVVILNKANRAQSIAHELNKQNHARPTRSIAVVPMVFQGKALGILCAESYRPSAYTQEDGRWLSILASQVGGLFAAMNNVQSDEDKESARARWQSTKLVLEAARRIGHEMNQPLTGISGYCALIMEEIDKANPIYDDLHQIELQTRRLEQLVYDFQSLTRSDSPQ